MSVQLEAEGLLDGRTQYNADVVLRLPDFKDAEILLLETSNGYNTVSRMKASFDHSKGMFGLLAMLKGIADAYNFADYDIFKTLKVHFLHAHGKSGINGGPLGANTNYIIFF